MSEQKKDNNIEKKNDPKNELEGIDVDFLLKVDKLNKKFFETLDNLKEARPTFQGIDEAFLSVSDNLLNAYQLVYRLLYEQYRGDIERLIAFFTETNDRIIPFRYKKWWQRRFRQNQAMDLVDKEADYEAMKKFAEKEHEMFEKYLQAQDGEQSESADIEQTDGKAKQGAEGAEGEPEQAAETAADKLMKEYRNKTKKKKTEKGAGNGNAGTGECT